MTTPLPRVRVSSHNPHLLETEDGKPFFLLGDTAWELIHRLTREDVDTYFANRAAKGFNVILVNVLAEFDGLRTPTAYGEVPFHDLDPTRPNEAYFQWVDEVIDRAVSHGLYIGLLPSWGDKLVAPWGDGPRVFTLDHPETAYQYARFLGERYASRTNLIWVLGGDRPAKLTDTREELLKQTGFTAETDLTPLWREFARGIRDGAGGKPLFTYHPQGGKLSTSVYLHDEEWLHINMMQSGHGGGHDVPVWDWITRDYNLHPVKPTLDGEPNYEDHPVNPWPTYDPANGYFRDDDVRKQCWRSVLAGACGVVYGHHAVWQFWSPEREMVNYADRYWTEAIDRPGAFQVGYLRRLMETRSYFTRVPDQSLIVSEVGTGGEHIRALRCAEGSHAFVYVPTASRLMTLDLTKLEGPVINAFWFDPRTAEETEIGLFARDHHTFTTPAHGPDWVLILESESPVS